MELHSKDTYVLRLSIKRFGSMKNSTPTRIWSIRTKMKSRLIELTVKMAGDYIWSLNVVPKVRLSSTSLAMVPINKFLILWWIIIWIILVSDCPFQPCKNGGTCFQSSNDGFFCTCPKNFHGRKCEHFQSGKKSNVNRFEIYEIIQFWP